MKKRERIEEKKIEIERVKDTEKEKETEGGEKEREK